MYPQMPNSSMITKYKKMSEEYPNMLANFGWTLWTFLYKGANVVSNFFKGINDDLYTSVINLSLWSN